ncbi:MAG: hypothetical protein AB1817_09135 [Chloroflexota bacterium]
MKPLALGFGLPAAIVAVTVQNPNDLVRQRELDGIVDTGADVTLIPYGLARQIGVRSHRRRQRHREIINSNFKPPISNL